MKICVTTIKNKTSVLLYSFIHFSLTRAYLPIFKPLSKLIRAVMDRVKQLPQNKTEGKIHIQIKHQK